MIGAPIYLVSACGSGAEFVAAFRRYADKQGIFVPIAEPFAIGRRGRMALTLKDGGVMIEGEAEVVMSSRTPSALYGRIGMTLRFVEPDEESRNVIGELERARLSMKPPETHAQPRPATIPAEPRAVVPTPGGRIDAANALAETVAIGDVSGLRESAGTPLKSGPKFVIPSIPVRSGDTKPPNLDGGPREPRETKPNLKLEDSKPTAKLDSKPKLEPAKLDSRPPAHVDSPTTPTAVDAPTAAKLDAPTQLAKPDSPPTPAHVDSPTTPTAVDALPPATVASPTPARLDPTPNPERAKVDSLAPTTVSPPPAKVEAPTPNPERAKVDSLALSPPPMPERAKVDSLAPTMVSPPPAPPAMVESPDVEPVPPPRTITQPVAVVPPPRPGTGDVTPMAVVRSPITSTQPVAVVPPAPRGRGTIPPNAPLKVPDATGPSAIIPDPPIVAAPQVIEESSPSREDPTVPVPGRPAMPEVEISEPTDLGYMPVPEPREPAFEPREPRRTVLGIAAVVVEPALPAARLAQEPEPDVVDPHADTLSPDAMMIFSPPRDDAPPPPTVRPIGLAHPPTVEESTPSGDWTMTPDGPMARAAPRPTGDWTISVDASAPDGWAPPEKPTVPARPTRRGPNVTSAASREDLILKQSWEPESTAMSMAKVEIDPTLMEPLLPMPEEDEAPQPGPATLPPPPMQPSPWPAVPNAPPMMQPMPMAMHTPLPMAVPPMPQQPYGAPVLTPVPGTYYTPVPGQVQFDPNQQVAMMGFPQQPRMSTEGGAVYFPDNVPSHDSTAIHEVGRRRRLLVIVMSAALVFALGVVLLVKLGGSKRHADEAKPDAAPKAALQPPPSDAAIAVVASDAIAVAVASDAATADAAALLPMPDATAATCTIDVVTNPPGAEVALDKSVLGTSPGTFPLPCGAEVKVFYRKAGYNGVIRTVTPTPEGTKVRISLLHVPFSVKVSSSPAGAAITANGRAQGVTPTVIKLPAFEAATIVFTKDGYTTDSEKITPKQDRQPLHVTLKKLLKRH